MPENCGCPNSGPQNRAERFLEVCLLFLLTEEPLHGYVLMEKLKEFGFLEADINIGSLYRTLRKMEGEKIVCSKWEYSEQGPKRRVYTITKEGVRNLEAWILIIKNKKNRIERLIQRYEQSLKE